MRIAATYDNGRIFHHFGRTEFFKIYDIEDGKIVASQVIRANGSGHDTLAAILQMNQVDGLICGGIGMGAQNALSMAGIKLYGGLTGDADSAAQALADGTLNYDAEVHCGHHVHHHGEHEGCCGGHGHHHEERHEGCCGKHHH